jgi:hypothetical protein
VSWRGWFGEMLVVGGLAALLSLPWLLKNLVLVGNPFYPILVAGNTFNPWQQTFRSGALPQRPVWRDLLLPFDAVFFSLEGALIEGKPEYGASLGPFVLALVPGLLVSWEMWSQTQRRSLQRLLAAAGCTWLLWAVTSHFADELMRSRHWYAAFGALAVLAVAGFQALSSVRLPGLRLGRVLSALVTLVLGMAGLNEVLDYSKANPLPVILGGQSQVEYLKQELGWYGAAVEAVNQLSPQAVVLFLWEPRTLYCQVHCLPDGKLDNWWYLRRAGGDAPAIVEILRQKGVTHVLVNENGLEWIKLQPLQSQDDPADWDALESFLQDHLHLVQQFGDSYSLYSLGGAQE